MLQLRYWAAITALRSFEILPSELWGICKCIYIYICSYMYREGFMWQKGLEASTWYGV